MVEVIGVPVVVHLTTVRLDSVTYVATIDDFTLFAIFAKHINFEHKRQLPGLSV